MLPVYLIHTVTGHPQQKYYSCLTEWAQVSIRPTPYQQCAKIILIVVDGEFSLRGPCLTSIGLPDLFLDIVVGRDTYFLISRYPTP